MQNSSTAQLSQPYRSPSNSPSSVSIHSKFLANYKQRDVSPQSPPLSPADSDLSDHNHYTVSHNQHNNHQRQHHRPQQAANHNQHPVLPVPHRPPSSTSSVGDRESRCSDSTVGDSCRPQSAASRSPSPANSHASSSTAASRLKANGESGGGKSSEPNPCAELCKPRCNCPELERVECRLENKDLWDRFHELGTEMIITKTGRY
ncbi:unnamed protein product, partial [Medioppia subpectinata]